MARRSSYRRSRKADSFDEDDLYNSDSDFMLESDFDEVENMDDWEEVLPPVARGSVSMPDYKPKPKRKGKKEREIPLCWERWEDENETAINVIVAKKSAVEGDFGEAGIVETVNQSPDILLPLLRFQKEWLAWALKQEDSEYRGGVLADEMGMGKTIQAISLVLTARELRAKGLSGGGLNGGVSCCSSSSGSLPVVKCTLVICPVVAVIQWMGEIERHTRKDSTRVLVYYGAKRGNTKYDFNNYDFVITTYSTAEYDYRKNIMPPKERCKWCDKMFYPNKMTVHLKYYCGPDAQKTEKQSKQATKKRKNKSVSEDENTNDLKKKGQSSKSQKNKGKKKVDKNDNADGDLDSPSTGQSILHSVKWERIILDEAHFIKDRRSNTAKSVFALESLYRWALSGTPLQNRVGELYSLVRFLQLYPYSYYLCKDCDCKMLDYSMSKNCLGCTHSSVRHFCWWNKYITKPIQHSSMSYDGKRAMILLKDRVLKSIVLRRTKEGRAADLALPPRIVQLRRDCMDKKEEEFYEALYTQSRVQFDTYADAGTLLNNYAHIFDLLTRLRQAVDHPYLVVYSKTAEVPDASNYNTEKQDCGICHDPLEDTVVTSCQHAFCKACLINYTAALGNVICPSCSKPLTVDLTSKTAEKTPGPTIKGLKSGILSRINTESFQTSTKIDALKEEIRDMLEADGSAKAIVFSQFTSFLDLIHFSLKKSGVKCVQLVGSMSLAERDKTIKTFTEDADCRIFLMSLKAGGVALNLTVASHVFLMDPWWNPAVERQAQDRIHRIGQYKPIKITRFVIENTVEERILKLQEKKELVFQGTIENSSEAMAKLTEADLRFLFHI